MKTTLFTILACSLFLNTAFAQCPAPSRSVIDACVTELALSPAGDPHIVLPQLTSCMVRHGHAASVMLNNGQLSDHKIWFDGAAWTVISSDALQAGTFRWDPYEQVAAIRPFDPQTGQPHDANAVPPFQIPCTTPPTPSPTPSPAPVLATCTEITGFYEQYLGREPAPDDCAKWLSGAYGETSKAGVEAQIAGSDEAHEHATAPAPTPSPIPTPEPTATPSPTPSPAPDVPPVSIPTTGHGKTFWSSVLSAIIAAILLYAKTQG